MAVCWCFSREVLEHQTPSREHGISWRTEKRYRKEGAKFIASASNTMGLRHDTLATGTVFFHRFFMVQSFREFDRWVVAAACLLLAGKVEETPKKCKDIIKVSKSLLREDQMKGFGSEHKEELLAHERVLLQTLKFDLQVEHPYNYLLKFAKSVKGDKSKVERIVQMAWTFINDSLCTTLCLQWEPKAIAVAFLYLAGKMAKFDMQTATQSRSRYWWRVFLDTLDVHDLDGICHQVLDLYGEQDREQSEESFSSENPLPTTAGTTGSNVLPPPPPPPPLPPPPPPHPPSTQPQLSAAVPVQSSYPASLPLSYGMTNPAQSLHTLVPPSSLPLPPLASSLPQPTVAVPSTHSVAYTTVSLLGAPPPQAVITGHTHYPTYQAAQHQTVAVPQIYPSSQQVPMRIGAMIPAPATPVGQPVYASTNTPPVQYQPPVTTPHLASGTPLSYSPSIPLPPSQPPYHPPPGHGSNWMRH